MTSLIGNPNFADLELHSNDDLHLPAHSCILRCRAPEFFSSNIGVNFDYEKSSSIVSKTVINVSTMDSDHLSKFVQHVYAGSDDDEVVATSDGEPLGLINEEALFGSSESRQSARTYICESSSTNVASWDGTFGENNENGNSLEIGSQSKSNECLACENTECFGECTTVRTSTQKSLEKRIGCETISDVAQGEVFPSEDNHLRSQEKAEPSDRPLAQASKGATLFPLFYTMDFSSSGDIRIYNSEALHSSLPRSKNPRAKSKSPIAVDSSVAKQGSMQSLNTITQTTMLLTEHSSSSQTLCTPCSKLGVSLLSMFRKGQDSDCIVLAKGDKFKAHK
uniref:BTB domain-containing protein n=1 Tax=Trichuris muris TaxID=70415 RepID=A0A5S6R0M8_TRIMR